MAVGVGIGIGSGNKEVKAVKAASTMVTGTRIFVEDRWNNSGWTGNNKNACLHIYNPSFKTGSGYTSFADIKLNDLYANSFATDNSTYLDVEMKWLSGSYNQQYEAILPWYLTGFKYEFYATENSVNRYVYNKNGGAKFAFTAEYGKNISVCFKDGSWGTGSTASNYYCNNEYYKNDGYTYEFNGIKSGSHMYLSTQDFTDWEDKSAKFAINFQKSNINKGESWSCEYDVNHSSLSQTFCWKVKGSGNDHLYECIVPQYNGQDVYWSMVIGVRFNPAATTLSWGDNVWNQTGDQFYNGDDSNCNMLWVNAATGGGWSGGGYLKTDASISDETRAGYYGTYFLSQITCETGSVDTPNNWTNVRNEYKQHLSTDVEGVVWLTSAAITGTDLVKAMYRYDYIVRKYGTSTYSDFIDRKPGTNRTYGFGLIFSSLNKDSNAVGLIVIISSIATVAAFAGYFFYKKKKEDK